MVVIDVQSFTVDNIQGSIPLNWSRLLNPLLVVPVGNWLNTGQLQLLTRIKILSLTNGDNIQGERFLNPTSLQIGSINLMVDSYITQRHRIDTLQQQITINHDQLEINNSRLVAARRFGLEQFGGKGHLVNTAEVISCVLGNTAPVAPPAVWEIFGQAVTPPGAICLASFPGQTTFTEVESYPPGTIHELNLDRLQLGWEDEIRGVVYGGFILEITVTTYYNEAINVAPIPVPVPTIQGDVIPAVYGYGCALGIPIPAPTNPPCPVEDLAYNGTQQGLTCGGG
jgi:hypothetical protein